MLYIITFINAIYYLYINNNKSNKELLCQKNNYLILENRIYGPPYELKVVHIICTLYIFLIYIL